MRGSTAIWAMLTILLLGALLPAINMAHASNLFVSNGTTLGSFEEGGGSNSTTFPLTPPTIQDFLINNTATGNTTQFAFIVSDSVALQNCTFSNDNGTGTWANSSLQLSGTGPTYANFTVNPFTVTTLLNFTFWLWNTNSSISPSTIGYRTLAIYNSSMPYTSLGNAIATVEGANNWTTANDALGTLGVDPYEGLILNKNTTAQYESLIDSYANGQATTIPVTEVFPSGTFTSTNWNNPSNAYDNNIATGASYTTAGSGQTTTEIGFNFSSPVNGTIIQYYCGQSGSATLYFQVNIANATGGRWVNVIGDSAWGTAPTSGAWTSITFSQSIYQSMEFEFYASTSTTVYLNETEAFASSYNTKLYDYPDVIQYCAYANKMNLTWAGQKGDIIDALGNISMCGSLPATDSNAYAAGYTSYPTDFNPQDGWALYGYYYAVEYNVDLTLWNITAAYNQFDSGVNYSITIAGVTGDYGCPSWIFSNGEGGTTRDRYYDEDAETIQAYDIFYSLLNVSAALGEALNCWNYLVTSHWNPLDANSLNQTLQYFRYSEYWSNSQPYEFECEAGFFLKDISILKYYSSNLANYTYVLTDIGTRFLSSEWNSFQWVNPANNASDYVVVHMYIGNDEERLENTLGAWQALLGCYLQMNSTYQNNMRDMLSGNTTSNIQPAWSLLLNSALWSSSTRQFCMGTSGESFSAEATALGEITLFQMGIVPGTSTVAFPLEELSYEYTDDIDPVLTALNQTARQITVPVVQAGTITFQYGQSPITYNFTSNGVYIISFTSSWNMISSVTYQSALPSNLIYFYLPAQALSVNISPTSVTLNVGQSQLFTSSVFGGTSPYTYQWSLNGSAVQDATSSSWNFTTTSAGPYTVYVEVNDSVGAQATSNTANVIVNPETHDITVTNVTSCQTITGQGLCNNITVTIANLGSYSETFNITAYANATVIATIANITLVSGSSVNWNVLWNTTGFAYGNYTLSAYAWPVPSENDTANNNFTGGVVTVTIPGDVDGNGRVDMGDIVSLCTAFGSTLGMPNYNPNCDIDNNGRIDMSDIIIALLNFGQHYP